MKPKVLFAGSSKSRIMPALALALATITSGHAQNLLVDGVTMEPGTGTHTFSATNGDSGVRNGGTYKVNTGVDVTVNNGSNSWFGIGDGSGSSLLWLNGGSMIINSNWGTVLGRTANGTITIDSGSLTINKGQGATDNALIMSEGGATGTLNLNGTGTLTTYKITSTGANTSQVFNFNGGTLKPTASKADWFANNGNILTQVRNGGAKIDTAGLDVTIGEQIVHSNIGGDNAIDGGFTKEGSGILTLSAANTFTGAVVVNGGTLSASTPNSAASGAFSFASGITVNNGATLRSGTNALFGWDGTKVKYIIVNSGGVLTMNDGADVNVGNVTLAGGTLAADGINHAGFGSWVFRHNSVLSVTENSTVSASNVLMNNGSSINVAAGKTLDFTGTLTNTSGNGIGVLIKTGDGTLTLTGTNTYTGATSVNGGKLVINGNNSAATGTITVGAGTVSATPVATLAGSGTGSNGTIGGSVVLTAESSSGSKNGGVLAPTAAASGTKLSVAGTTTFNTGSIFEWSMSATDPATDPGVVSNSGSYGQLAGTGAISGSNAVFNIVLGSGNAFTDAFWNTNKTWNDIFTGAGAPSALTSIFSSISGAGITFADNKGTVDGQGYFTLSGTSTSLTWTAVPEPTTALAGLLLTAGLLRRRR